MEKLLHTPEGVRDIYNVECGKKLALENRLKKTLHLFGYHDIQTPTFEYFDVFRKEIGTIPSKDLYKFFFFLLQHVGFCDQISHRPSHVWLLHYLERKISRYGFVTQVIHLLTIPTIRDD